jgi:hypothetical protein
LNRSYRYEARHTANFSQAVDLKAQLSFAAQIASGMVALAKQFIVHRNLAAFLTSSPCFFSFFSDIR